MGARKNLSFQSSRKIPLIVLGSGSFAKEACNWCVQSGYRLKAFFSEDDYGRTLRDLPIIGDFSDLDEEVRWVVGVGTPQIAERLAKLAKSAGIKGEAVVHPSAITGSNVVIGEGTMVCPGCILTCDITVGTGSLINIGCTIGHDCEIGDFTHLAPNTSLSGLTKVGSFCEIGTGVSTIPNVRINDRTVVGAGAVVVKDIGPGTYIGVPAKRV